MNALITSGEALTPERLTDILYRNGHMTTGKATETTVRSSEETPPSIVARIDAAYSSDAPMSAPKRLFLKIPKPETLPAEA